MAQNIQMLMRNMRRECTAPRPPARGGVFAKDKDFGFDMRKTRSEFRNNLPDVSEGSRGSTWEDIDRPETNDQSLLRNMGFNAVDWTNCQQCFGSPRVCERRGDY